MMSPVFVKFARWVVPLIKHEHNKYQRIKLNLRCVDVFYSVLKEVKCTFFLNFVSSVLVAASRDLTVAFA